MTRTNEDIIRHVDQAILDASISKTWMNPRCADIRGFTTTEMRRLWNNVVRWDGPRSFAECGLYAGASFCSAISNQTELFSYGFEDFSQPFGVDGIFDQLEANIAEFQPKDGKSETHLIKQDFFEWCKAPDRQFSKWDVFVYDGNHDEVNQMNAMKAAYPYWNDKCIIMVDDFDWASAREGTWKGLIELDDNISIEKAWQLTDGRPDGPRYHNGLGIFLINKV